ncbi:MAG: c-type cytochrome [Nannocystis sp.]|nr:cytochrome c peroxidase [Nannocystis sp.]MBA3547921.1 c-type cytochrome [Nannocystis sp.]
MSSRLVLVSLLVMPFTLSFGCGEAGKVEPRQTEVKSDAKDAADVKPVAGPEEYAWVLPRGLKAPAVPEDNAMSADKVELGHQLFFDKRLSVDGTRSCYSCHQNELGNADGREKALGPGDKLLARNTPTIWNVAYHAELYWDGRSGSLEKQMIGAWKGGNMAVGEPGLAAKAAEIGALPEYRAQFRKVFGIGEAEAVTPEHVAKAVSAFERTLLCGDTAWDSNTLSPEAQRGWELFRGKAACGTCHSGDNFADGLYHKVGVGVPESGEGGDQGRLDASKAEGDRYKFRTPTMRNIGKTAPYFHDGSVADLREAVKLMASGGDRKIKDLDKNLADRGLTDAEIDDLVVFLRALDCPGSLAVIGDQAVAGISDRGAGGAAKPAPSAG